MKCFSKYSPIRLVLTLPCGMVCAFLFVIAKSCFLNLINSSSALYIFFEQLEPKLTVWTLLFGFLVGVILMKGKTLSTPMEDPKTPQNSFTQGRIKINDLRYLLMGVYILLWIIFLVITVQLGIAIIDTIFINN